MIARHHWLNIQLISGEFLVQLVCLRRSGVWRVGGADYRWRRTSRLSAILILVSLSQMSIGPNYHTLQQCRDSFFFSCSWDQFETFFMLLFAFFPLRVSINYSSIKLPLNSFSLYWMFREVLRRFWSFGRLIKCMYLECSCPYCWVSWPPALIPVMVTVSYT